jgi:hypothetical protein
MHTCIKCKRNPATVAEPCCAAPDCVDTVYFYCAECDQAEWDELANSAAEYDMQNYFDNNGTEWA